MENMEETGFTRQNSYTLLLLTLSFIIGEISHFLIGVVSMDVARDLHYGDKACAQHPNTSLRYVLIDLESGSTKENLQICS